MDYMSLMPLQTVFSLSLYGIHVPYAITACILLILVWTTCPLSHNRLYSPYPCMTTCPLSHNRLYSPYPCIDYMSLMPWQTTFSSSLYRLHAPYSMTNDIPLFHLQTTCPWPIFKLHPPYPMTDYMSLIHDGHTVVLEWFGNQNHIGSKTELAAHSFITYVLDFAFITPLTPSPHCVLQNSQ